MSDYCTKCIYLSNNKSNNDSWHICKKIIPNLVLTSLCGNPKKLAQCISENWYEKAKPIHIAKPACITCGRPLVETIAAGYVCYKCDEEFNRKEEKAMKTKEMIEVMQAQMDGKQIEYKPKNYTANWNPIADPSWEWGSTIYRVKPEPKYKPLKPEELITLKGKWLKTKEGSLAQVTGISFKNSVVSIFTGWYNPDELLKDWTYENLEPIGILE